MISCGSASGAASRILIVLNSSLKNPPSNYSPEKYACARMPLLRFLLHSLRQPQRVSNRLEQRPVIVNSQDAIPLQNRLAFRGVGCRVAAYLDLSAFSGRIGLNCDGISHG